MSVHSRGIRYPIQPLAEGGDPIQPLAEGGGTPYSLHLGVPHPAQQGEQDLKELPACYVMMMMMMLNVKNKLETENYKMSLSGLCSD